MGAQGLPRPTCTSPCPLRPLGFEVDICYVFPTVELTSPVTWGTAQGHGP